MQQTVQDHTRSDGTPRRRRRAAGAGAVAEERRATAERGAATERRVAEAGGTTGDDAPDEATVPDDADVGVLPDMPMSEDDFRDLGKYEARALGDALLRRLSEVERESGQYRYVRDTLIRLNLPLVRYIAVRYRYRPEPLDDIVQVGVIGLIKAVDGYDPDRGVEFVSYAIPTIAGEIKRFFRDTSWSVRVPRPLKELSLDAARAADELEQDLGRAPTHRELAGHLSVEVHEVVAALEAARLHSASSLDALRDRADGADGAGSSLLDRLGAPDEALDLVEFRESVGPLLNALPPRERSIILMRFYGNMSQSQIGERLGLSQMHVSRLLSATLRSLREQMEEQRPAPRSG
ncbi:SigB/SigF/SigG family RNA polymerase sigma factor [Allostreptomyces psammosilenae]|uniref:RNA polymerase sigma-B factor n=1 Tax=Allostreptomyces psammosilenae TaxID=1892865 RepID=A0A852ZZU7_9ACTN|nr:SigB/SigF/SigG family RNA polymerase sigma factor [Allostreptomyces psammosilenae]NYI04101.1 RNA polymerase sigma-B factor [Allostreptomyces psammosilenae]